jgi:hypothetical protein
MRVPNCKVPDPLHCLRKRFVIFENRLSINRVSARRQDFSALLLRERVSRSRKRRNRQRYQTLGIHQNPGEVWNHVAG